MNVGFVFDDGGRSAAGYKGIAGDCACRSIAIATEKPCEEVYNALNSLVKQERPGKKKKRKLSARTGISMPLVKKYMTSVGWKWIPTMKIGQGCKVHLKAEELPSGRLVVRVSKHLTAMIEGVIHDTSDPRRIIMFYEEGKLIRTSGRCVYGYFVQQMQ